MSRRKHKTREEVCLLFYQRMASQPFRHRRDGKMFKAWWLTRRQTTWLRKVPARNGGYFYRTDLRRPANEWVGVFEHEGVTMLVSVVVAYRGTSYITVTKEKSSPETTNKENKK